MKVFTVILGALFAVGAFGAAMISDSDLPPQPPSPINDNPDTVWPPRCNATDPKEIEFGVRCKENLNGVYNPRICLCCVRSGPFIRKCSFKWNSSFEDGLSPNSKAPRAVEDEAVNEDVDDEYEGISYEEFLNREENYENEQEEYENSENFETENGDLLDEESEDYPLEVPEIFYGDDIKDEDIANLDLLNSDSNTFGPPTSVCNPDTPAEMFFGDWCVKNAPNGGRYDLEGCICCRPDGSGELCWIKPVTMPEHGWPPADYPRELEAELEWSPKDAPHEIDAKAEDVATRSIESRALEAPNVVDAPSASETCTPESPAEIFFGNWCETVAPTGWYYVPSKCICCRHYKSIPTCFNKDTDMSFIGWPPADYPHEINAEVEDKTIESRDIEHPDLAVSKAACDFTPEEKSFSDWCRHLWPRGGRYYWNECVCCRRLDNGTKCHSKEEPVPELGWPIEKQDPPTDFDLEG